MIIKRVERINFKLKIMEAKKFLIIDTNSILYRAFHALPPLKTKKGELVNGIYGFLLVFLKVLKAFQPEFVVATFDLPYPTFRHQEFKEYKAQRPSQPQELYQQLNKVKEVLEAFGVPIFEKPGFEADDLIGTLTSKFGKKQIFPRAEIIVLSGDLDTLQLVDSQTKVWTMKKGLKETALYDEEEVGKRYQGLKPFQLPDFRGLKGDPSDNIPGVPGIGEKTALFLIKEFGNLENLYQEIEKNSPKAEKIKEKIRQFLKQYKKEAFFSKKLSQIKKDVPIELKIADCRFGKFDQEKIKKLFEELEFYTLFKRLEQIPFFQKQNQLGLKFPKFLGKENSKREAVVQEIERLYQQGIFSKFIYQLEKKLVPLVEEMEKRGIKIEKEALFRLSQKLEKKLNDLQGKIYQLAKEEFNLNSPQQVSRILFQKLKISPSNLKKTPQGIISTSSSELKKIKEFHPIIGLILKYRELFKLKSGFVNVLSKMIGPDGRIHPHFHQLGAETGRMSCSQPNLQNIPFGGELGESIRGCFIPQTGFQFLGADYSQMELRIAGFLAQDKKMIELFKKGKDIHQLVASEIFQIPEEEVSPNQRALAKSLNFALLYGIGVQGFAKKANLSFKEAQDFIKKYFEKFSALAKYRENLIQRAKKQGFVETLFGRKRILPELNSIDQRLKSQAERIAINTKIQGTASEIIKMAMVELKQRKVISPDCYLLLQIHDELLFEIKKEKLMILAPKIKEIMENILGLKFPKEKFTFPLKIELKKGKNWGNLESLEVVQRRNLE